MRAASQRALRRMGRREVVSAHEFVVGDGPVVLLRLDVLYALRFALRLALRLARLRRLALGTFLRLVVKRLPPPGGLHSSRRGLGGGLGRRPASASRLPEPLPLRSFRCAVVAITDVRERIEFCVRGDPPCTVSAVRSEPAIVRWWRLELATGDSASHAPSSSLLFPRFLPTTPLSLLELLSPSLLLLAAGFFPFFRLGTSFESSSSPSPFLPRLSGFTFFFLILKYSMAPGAWRLAPRLAVPGKSRKCRPGRAAARPRGTELERRGLAPDNSFRWSQLRARMFSSDTAKTVSPRKKNLERALSGYRVELVES